jgi:hypothetical protein
MAKKRKSFGKVLSPYGGTVGGSTDSLCARWGIRHQPPPGPVLSVTRDTPTARRNHGVGNDKAWAREMRRLPCHYCGDSGGTIDHVIPYSHGGRDIYENCLPACARCNTMRGSFKYEDFLAAVKFGMLDAIVGSPHPNRKRVAYWIMSALRVQQRPVSEVA